MTDIGFDESLRHTVKLASVGSTGHATPTIAGSPTPDRALMPSADEGKGVLSPLDLCDCLVDCACADEGAGRQSATLKQSYIMTGFPLGPTEAPPLFTINEVGLKMSRCFHLTHKRQCAVPVPVMIGRPQRRGQPRPVCSILADYVSPVSPVALVHDVVDAVVYKERVEIVRADAEVGDMG